MSSVSLLGELLFGVALDDAAPHVLGVGGVSALPFVVLAHVYESRFGIRREASSGLLDGEFAHTRLGVCDQFQEAFGMLHRSALSVHVANG